MRNISKFTLISIEQLPLHMFLYLLYRKIEHILFPPLPHYLYQVIIAVLNLARPDQNQHNISYLLRSPILVDQHILFKHIHNKFLNFIILIINYIYKIVHYKMNNGVQTFIVITIIIIFILVIINIYYRNKILEPIIPYVTFSVLQDDGCYRYYNLPPECIPMLEKISGNLYLFYGDGIKKMKISDDARMHSVYNGLKRIGIGNRAAAIAVAG